MTYNRKLVLFFDLEFSLERQFATQQDVNFVRSVVQIVNNLTGLEFLLNQCQV